jgi:hypothetical protein
MSFFYEIRSADNVVLKRDGGYPDREAATVAAREDAKKLKLSKHLGVPMVGKILVGQSVEQPIGRISELSSGPPKWIFAYDNMCGSRILWDGFAFPGGRSFAVFEGAEGLTFLLRVCYSVDGINPDQSVPQIGVEGKTAPGPIFGMIDQFSFQRIHMHILKFFNSLLRTPHIEIAEAALPKARLWIVTTGKDQM